MAYHQSHLRSAIAGRRHLGDASIGAKIGLSSRRSSRVVLEGKELFPYSPFDYAIQEVDSQGYARAVPSSVRKVMAMSRRKKAALKGIDHKREPSSVIDNKKTSFVSFTLCKVDMSTLTAIANISSATGIPVQEFIFTDKTDSYALTGQRICVRSEYLASLREFEAQQNFLDGFGITECSYMEEDISPYAPHVGNLYRLRFPMNSHLVGDALLVKDFPRAMRLLIEYFRETTTSEVLKEAAEE
ncbi:hypothetical protein Pmar_PMAR015206 [Perkinsus marinus ATCC 50983]|uniref:Uncharacterized protein n=1 Tax=Perkinsus marinus (strain ATCC 50983 / TXsc) TaxID=423536 RepID=C5K5Q0_PERM5|nr:hypothetical protein Pmar_PMAR015206 [Perkinsus marinus ATCC 50983]EER20207.1 hypothetical protein Pmar_PMAR015206 [Perkinsus marinus ATCC 50983]|eukprot:XP_002788411.1 hypothetical protein Pmar_PMAR015206 [Perkinsus marinus ATCC 50983]